MKIWECKNRGNKDFLGKWSRKFVVGFPVFLLDNY